MQPRTGFQVASVHSMVLLSLTLRPRTIGREHESVGLDAASIALHGAAVDHEVPSLVIGRLELVEIRRSHHASFISFAIVPLCL